MTPEEMNAIWAKEQAEKKEKTDPVVTAISRIKLASTILATEYPEPKWAVKGILPEGTTFIAGPPKLGKSIFALNIAVAVSTEGGKALSHFDVESGSVLYLALEDGERRIKQRLMSLTNGKVSNKLQVNTEWPRLNKGGLEAIGMWLDSHDDARLIIIDTLKMIKPLILPGDRSSMYDQDYDSVSPLTKIASQRVCLLIVHHSRKAHDDDPLAMISGSYGLTGGVDGALVLKRSRNKSDATLQVIGRDVDEQELALKFEPNMALWRVIGKSDEVRRSDERADVLKVLAEAEGLLKPSEIAEILDKPASNIRTLLFRMKQDGDVKLFHTRYQLPTFKIKTKKNVTSLPVTFLTGNAPNDNDDNEIEEEHYNVTGIQGNGKDHEAEDSNSGNVVTIPLELLHQQELIPLPAENVTGNEVTFFCPKCGANRYECECIPF